MIILKCPHCGSPDIFRQHIDDDGATWMCERCSETFWEQDDLPDDDISPDNDDEQRWEEPDNYVDEEHDFDDGYGGYVPRDG